MALQSDIQYQRSREQLLPYEDARFNGLLAGVPDSYYPVNDNMIWGSVLRAIAMELARLEIQLSYELVSEEVQYLTPPDIRRQLMSTLSVSQNYPQPAQYDRDYRDMLVRLFYAYREGVTPKAISDVIFAYTGQTISVVELYKLIGDGVHDASDRNTVQVTIELTDNPLAGQVSAQQIQTITQVLFAALQLATPAHVGIDYIVAFGDAEDATRFTLGITDTLSFEYDQTENPNYPPVFTDAPMFNPSSPDTELTALGKRVGTYLAANISAAQYAALMSVAFQSEYAVNQDGSYSLLPTAVDDVILVDNSGNPTGAISKAVGVLAPSEVRVWAIKSDDLEIYSLD